MVTKLPAGRIPSRPVERRPAMGYHAVFPGTTISRESSVQPTDKIIVRDLLVRGIIGINDWERETKQDIRINHEILVDARRAGRSDDLADALNYRTLTKRIIAYVESSDHFLVEALAHEIARLCLLEPGADRVVVRVEKPGALRFATSVGVEVERRAADFDDNREDGSHGLDPARLEAPRHEPLPEE